MPRMRPLVQGGTDPDITHLPLVIIRWKDHNSQDDWLNHKEAKENATVMIMSSVGWLVNETDDVYQIASSFSHDDDQFSMIMNIVKDAVLDTVNVPRGAKSGRKKR